MRNLFNMDNPLFRFLSKVADMMILNLLFILCSIPVFTIGASMTAMYYTCLKMLDNEEGYISRNFFHSFKENFKQATVCWLFFLVTGVVLAADIMILRGMTGSFTKVIAVAVLALAVLYLIMLNYVFAVLSRFYNSTKNTFKNALIMAIASFPFTMVILVLTIAPVLVTLINGYTIWYGLMVWILVGFSVTAYGKCWFFARIFKKFMPKDEEEEKDPDDWVLDEDEVIKADAPLMLDDDAPAAADEAPEAAPVPVDETRTDTPTDEEPDAPAEENSEE